MLHNWPVKTCLNGFIKKANNGFFVALHKKVVLSALHATKSSDAHNCETIVANFNLEGVCSTTFAGISLKLYNYWQNEEFK